MFLNKEKAEGGCDCHYHYHNHYHNKTSTSTSSITTAKTTMRTRTTTTTINKHHPVDCINDNVNRNIARPRRFRTLNLTNTRRSNVGPPCRRLYRSRRNTQVTSLNPASSNHSPKVRQIQSQDCCTHNSADISEPHKQLCHPQRPHQLRSGFLE